MNTNRFIGFYDRKSIKGCTKGRTLPIWQPRGSSGRREVRATCYFGRKARTRHGWQKILRRLWFLRM